MSKSEVTRRAATGATVLIVTLGSLSGCQWPRQHEPPAAPSSTSPPSASATPHETREQRLVRTDKRQAEKAYLAATSEGDRLAMVGGATRSTAVLRNNLGGHYLEFQVWALR